MKIRLPDNSEFVFPESICFDSHSKKDKLTIKASGTITTDSKAETQGVYDNICANLNAPESFNLYEQDSDTRFFNCTGVKIDRKEIREAFLGKVVDISLSFELEDIYLHSDPVTVNQVVSGSTILASINNPGSEKGVSSLTISATGATSLNGDVLPGVRFTTPLNISNGDVLELTETTAKLNGVSVLNYLDDSFLIEGIILNPGSNNISISGVNINATFSFSFSPRWF